MPDMLVKLYDLPDLHEPLCRTKGIGIETRRPNPWEKSILLEWVGSTFSSTWALECETAFAANPFSRYIAVEKDTLMGCALLISGAAVAAGKDQYHVYQLGNGECVIDTRDHDKMKDQRGTDFCLGHFDYRMDAEKRRAELVKSGACKCPAGQNC